MTRLASLITQRPPERGEEDRRDITICHFFEKTGTCTRGPKGTFCRLRHVQRFMSRCLVFHHLYPNLDYFNSFLPPEEQVVVPDWQRVRTNDAFFIDIFIEFSQFGKVEDMFIASNISKHMYGNVYVRFKDVDAAMACHDALEGRFYAGRKVCSTFLPQERLSSAICKEDSEGHCLNGNCCPYPHKMRLSRTVLVECFTRVKQINPTELIHAPLVPYIDDPNDIMKGITLFYQKNPDLDTIPPPPQPKET